MKTIGERKNTPDATIRLGEVKIPSYYGEGYIETFEKDKSKISHDDQAVRLQSEVLNTLNANRKDLKKLNDARFDAHKDPTNTKATAEVIAFEVSEKVRERIYERSGPMEQKVRDYSASVQQQIDNDLRRAVSDNRDPGRVQDYLLKLPEKNDRLSFLRNAINKGDIKTVSAVVEDHAYLSGLDDDDISHIRQSFIEKQYPDEVQTMDYLKKLAEQIGRGYSATMENLNVLDTKEVRSAIELRDRSKRSRTFE